MVNRRVLVGLLLLGALIIFALATFYIENLERYINKGYEITARFETAQTLQVGDEVRMAGVEVGRLGKLSVDTAIPTDRPVEAVLWIRPGVTIRAKDVAHVETRSVFGGSFITISQEDPEAPALKNGDVLENTDIRPSITELISKAGNTLDQASKIFTDAQDALAKAGRALDNADQAFANFKEVTSTIDKDELKATVDSARKAFEGIEQVTTDLREGKGLAARLLNDEALSADVDQLASDAKEVAASLKQITANLEAGQGSIGKALKDDELYVELKTAATQASEAFASVQKLADQATTGQGPLQKLLYDENLSKDLDQIAADTKAFTAALAKLSEGLEGSKLAETIDELHNITAAISEKKGTAGMLIYEDTLHKQLTGALTSVQQMLDDFREQSPILTFAGAIFGAF